MSGHNGNKKKNAKKAKFTRLEGGGLRNARPAGEGLGGVQRLAAKEGREVEDEKLQELKQLAYLV